MTSSCGLLMMNTTPSLRQRSGLCASTSTTGGSFGSILSNWKKRDSSCSYTDRISLVGLARNPRVLQNLQAQRHKRQHLSIRFFRSKRFQHTVSKIIENDNTDGTETTVDNDLSETHTYDDPEELIVQKAESATSIVISESFETHYTVGRKLGEGAYATVVEATHHDTGETYAVKMVDCTELTMSELKALHAEMGIMAKLQHEHIVGLHEIYKVDTEWYYMVMEYVHGGELLDRLVQKEFYSEKEARDVAKQLFDAMAYCHRRKIAHRDLKPENLLLVSNDDDANVKICDFGFAKQCPPEGLTTLCGTPSYVAPEIITCVEGTGPYDFQCDQWSLGVICYILLSGYCPFGDGSDERAVYRLVKAGEFEFHAEYWDPVSNHAKDFISRLLTVNPDKRMTATEAVKHPWLTADETTLMHQDLSGNLGKMTLFNGKRKFRAAIHTLIAAQRICHDLDIPFSFGQVESFSMDKCDDHLEKVIHECEDKCEGAERMDENGMQEEKKEDQPV